MRTWPGAQNVSVSANLDQHPATIRSLTPPDHHPRKGERYISAHMFSVFQNLCCAVKGQPVMSFSSFPMRYASNAGYVTTALRLMFFSLESDLVRCDYEASKRPVSVVPVSGLPHVRVRKFSAIQCDLSCFFL